MMTKQVNQYQMKFVYSLIYILFFAKYLSFGQYYTDTYQSIGNQNKTEREEWLKDAGFGMFIHFSFDSQLGIVISHSMAGASDDYLNRFIHELPKTFNPYEFKAREIAKLAKLAGMKYVVLTTKHHSGFCLWDTQTTDFNIMNTEYGKDIVKEYVDALREYDLGVGFYFSPEDFHFLYQEGQQVRRRGGKPLDKEILDRYFQLTREQCRELMTNYGKIDVMFFDGGEGGVQEVAKETCWMIQPDLLVTRGALETPEQTLPGLASDKAWEACITMGTQWQYKPTNDNYKSGTRLIEILIETRAKGGALLLNVGPKPDGALPVEQESRLRELAAWHFINQEAVHDVRPWIVTNEENLWFVKSKNNPDVYIFLTRQPDWPRGERREFMLHSVRATSKTEINVLGQSGELVEYMPDIDGKAYYEQKPDGLEISLVRAQRIYNNHQWHNPLVVKLTNIEPALEPPVVQTLDEDINDIEAILRGNLVKTGNTDKVKVGFYYRPYAGFAENLYSDTWENSKYIELKKPGKFEVQIDDLSKGKTYEYRAVVIHPKIKMYGDIKRFTFH